MKDILVVKIGGSSAASPDLSRWIAAVEASSRPTVIVPGGGPFANAVRRHQATIGYDDAAAHEMAILAMAQFACALESLGDRLERAADEAAIDAVLERGRIAVWTARGAVLDDPSIEKSWSVTSDTLAAWLAQRLGARDLLLVKRIGVSGSTAIDALVGADIVDPSFPRHLGAETRAFIAGPGDLASAPLLLSEGTTPGRPVERRRETLVAAE